MTNILLAYENEQKIIKEKLTRIKNQLNDHWLDSLYPNGLTFADVGDLQNVSYMLSNIIEFLDSDNANQYNHTIDLPELQLYTLVITQVKINLGG